MATTMKKSTTATFSGILTRCDQRTEKATDFLGMHKYSPNSEYYRVILDCAIRLEDGSSVYFVVGSPMTIGNGGGAAVVTFGDAEYNAETKQYEFPINHSWFRKAGTITVATAVRASDVRLESKWEVGDSIKVTGRVKKEATSKAGNRYKVLTHVKLAK